MPLSLHRVLLMLHGELVCQDLVIPAFPLFHVVLGLLELLFPS